MGFPSMKSTLLPVENQNWIQNRTCWVVGKSPIFIRHDKGSAGLLICAA